MIRYLLIILFISSCSFMDKQNLLVLKNSITGYPQNVVTAELYAQKKFSFVEVSLGRGPSAILSLSSIKKNIYKWQSSDDVAIYTYNGFVLKTEGLEHNIETNYYNLQLDQELIQNINYLNPPLFGIELDISILSENKAKLKKGPFDIETKLIHIRKRIPFLKWNKVDKFWINKETDLVEKSWQYIHPDLPKMNLIFYYKY